MTNKKLIESDKAPDFSAPDQSGKIRSLSEFYGKWLLLYFYPKDFTAGCTVEAEKFRDNFEKLKSLVTILGASADDVSSHSRFCQKYNLPFDLISDSEEKVIKSYGADGIIFARRCSFLIDPKGIIRKIYDKVDPKAHAQQIIQDLERL
ncbi:MAG: alkyl hydroperoxide reductase, peroxiredoxin Q/BCP [Candidatus Wolfebacteria bacterium GW2011_GWC1_43_10]|uniref:thioredoxin-dependent peroxiredoxin n=2 Tax=Candidatus Wolfeibacteriota TaxID=1752735 RepID=A0A0G1CAZ3_9BACT|nr:MAG: alkyl hydroperoxide reductase, peroxiredoxin Q/BCP [Candidatus Wolfebacteria bacterium GW2011_GWC1_43_10]KKT22912.1 MAG: Alkyl hydroperoxide reductase/ Thiol specific antioxidant/ Mal allergen [Parcubacteria group bacterium GW2011_GWB1_43_8b]OGM89058.1 MAG: hypothetical protein A2108_02855 [Candidatus Wolfebacteria bacterium GWA1_42_9]